MSVPRRLRTESWSLSTMANDRVTHHASLRALLDEDDNLRAKLKRVQKDHQQIQGMYNVLQGQQQQLRDCNVTQRTKLANEREKTAKLESRCDEQTDVVRGLKAALKDAIVAASEAESKLQEVTDDGD